MTEAEKIIYTATIGFIIWFLQKAISYIVFRSRITQSLLSDMKLNADQVQEAYDYLKKFEKTYLIEGNKLEYINKFIKNETSYYQCQLAELPKYYSRKTIDRLSKFYYSLWELTMIIEGLVNYLTHLYESNTVLSDNEILRATKKLSRIYKLAEIILRNKTTSLSDLIDNYEGRLGPDSTI